MYGKGYGNGYGNNCGYGNSYGNGYGCGNDYGNGGYGGRGSNFALIVVLFILLIIVGATFMKH